MREWCLNFDLFSCFINPFSGYEWLFDYFAWSSFLYSSGILLVFLPLRLLRPRTSLSSSTLSFSCVWKCLVLNCRHFLWSWCRLCYVVAFSYQYFPQKIHGSVNWVRLLTMSFLSMIVVFGPAVSVVDRSLLEVWQWRLRKRLAPMWPSWYLLSDET